MNAVTHALTMSGRINTQLKDRFDPPERIIRKRLSLLDGRSRFSLGLWSLPEGVPFDQVDLDSWPTEYIQAAGSRERMTVEVRKMDAGQAQQYVVGHGASSLDGGGQTEVIQWNGYETKVRPSEVFNAHEAADLFVSYYATGWIPEAYALRLLDL